jgi:hypothetical protein
VGHNKGHAKGKVYTYNATLKNRDFSNKQLRDIFRDIYLF